MPRSFTSDVTKIEDGVAQSMKIRMNEPLRRLGYTLYQSKWGEDPRTREPYSILEVAKNPSDQWPLYACLVISAGLLLHFVQRLVRYLMAEAGRRS